MSAVNTTARCPFFGTPLHLWDTVVGWFATADDRDQGWASVLFPTKEALLAALTPLVVDLRLPAQAPILVCPFSGREIVVRPAGEGKFEAVVDGLWVSRPLVGRRRVEYMVSTRGGIPPLFDSAVESRVSVREREAPPAIVPIEVPEGEGALRESIERLVSDSRGGRPTVVVDGRKGRGLRGRRADQH